MNDRSAIESGGATVGSVMEDGGVHVHVHVEVKVHVDVFVAHSGAS